jgi:LEA14-like dessication related protein
MRPLRSLACTLSIVAMLVSTGCATTSDPMNVTVAGIEPLKGEGLEVRMLVKLRIQNPNDKEISYTGASTKIDVMGRTFATCVSDATGTVPRFGEAVVEVPVTVSVLRMVMHALGMLDGKPIDKVQYSMSGKLQTGALSAKRFRAAGVLELPKGPPPAPAAL